MEGRAIVYLAGPSYNREESAGMEAIAALLEESGYGVYLPSRDGLAQRKLALDIPESDAGQGHGGVLRDAAFALAVYQLARRCDVLVFNMNGRLPDEGGTFEAAVAFALGKPVILYKRDHRTKLHGNDNAMITGLSREFSTVTSARDLPRAIARGLGQSAASAGQPAAMPPFVELTAQLGQDIWESLQKLEKQASPTATEAFFDDLSSVLADSADHRLSK